MMGNILRILNSSSHSFLFSTDQSQFQGKTHKSSKIGWSFLRRKWKHPILWQFSYRRTSLWLAGQCTWPFTRVWLNTKTLHHIWILHYRINRTGTSSCSRIFGRFIRHQNQYFDLFNLVKFILSSSHDPLNVAEISLAIGEQLTWLTRHRSWYILW